MKPNKEADPPDNASLYRFLFQRKIQAMPEVFFVNIISPAYHIMFARNDHLLSSLWKGSSQLLPVWSE
jgi:hypothetical protein